MTAQPVAVMAPEWMTMARVTAMAATMPRDGDLVTAPRGGRVVHQVQAEHEARRGQHVDQLGDPGEAAHADRPAEPPFAAAAPAEGAAPADGAGAVGRFLNIFSIRPVTA